MKKPRRIARVGVESHLLDGARAVLPEGLTAALSEERACGPRGFCVSVSPNRRRGEARALQPTGAVAGGVAQSDIADGGSVAVELCSAGWIRASARPRTDRNVVVARLPSDCRAVAPTVSRERRLEEFIDQEWGAQSVRTQAKNISILKVFFEWATLNGKLHGDPMRPIKPPQKRGVERTIFSEDQERAILASNERSDRLALHLLFKCGVRKSELRSIQFRHFDHPQKRLTVFRKGGRVPVVPTFRQTEPAQPGRHTAGQRVLDHTRGNLKADTETARPLVNLDDRRRLRGLGHRPGGGDAQRHVGERVVNRSRQPLRFPCSGAVYAPGRNRTCDLALRRRTLYPLSYRRARASVAALPG